MTAFLCCTLAVICLSLFPTRFQSQDTIIVNFDFNNSTEWNDKTMLRASESVGKALFSTVVMEQVLQQAHQAGIQLSENDFRRHSQAEQKFYSWVLTIESASAEKAHQLMAIWVNAAEAVYRQDMASVQELMHWREWNQLAIQCLQKQPAEPINAFCQFPSNEAIQMALAESQAKIEELEKSISFFSATPPNFWLEISSPSSSGIQTLYDTAPIIYLLSAIAGFGAGWLSLRIGLPAKLLPKGWLFVA